MTAIPNPLIRLRELGQSPWCDQLSRQLLESGELRRLIANGIVGVTSNPTIFQKAIGAGGWYDDRVSELMRSGVEEPNLIYETLAVADIQAAADLLLPVYEETHGLDGYVSLEVSPELASDSRGSIAEGRRLWAAVARPNLMIKIPATRAGLPAISALLADGINVNVTLIFGLARYRHVLVAHAAGLERAREAGRKLTSIASVASFFVSRVDTLVDRLLALKVEIARRTTPEQVARLDALKGRAAVANARAAYQIWQEAVDSAGYARLIRAGARPQRLLWASTGTKNPAYSDVMYVEELIGPQTVNTMPPETIAAFLDHGRAGGMTLLDGAAEARTVLEELARARVKMDSVADQLEEDGVRLFAESFHQLVAALTERAQALQVGSP